MNYSDLDLDVSYFSLHTEKLIEVLYEREHCGHGEKSVSLLCSRVIATNRFPDIQSSSFLDENNDNIDNQDTSEDELDLYSVNRKLGSLAVENEEKKPKLYEKESAKIMNIIKNMGLVCEYDKMYTMQPSQLYCYKHNITSYSPIRNYLSPLSESSSGSSDSCNGERKFLKPIPFKLSLENHMKNSTVENRNYNQHKSMVSQKYSRYSYQEKKHSYWHDFQIKLPSKYWFMRRMLFSKFDDGILLDDESFYSVCPEVLSYHIAKRCENDIAMDPFCGAGGNIIQLALTCKLVIAIDIDPDKIRLAKNNAEIYGVADKIEFVVGDFFTISSMLQADVIFMSPPWGGPEYSGQNFSLSSMCSNYSSGGYGIFNIVKNIAPSIAFHMPKTTNILECLWLARGYGRVEIQQNIINKRLNSITAFFGDFTDVTDDDY